MEQTKTTKLVVPGDVLLERYKILSDVHKQDAPYKTRIFRCYDYWSDKIVVLKCVNISDVIHGIQQYKAAIISAELSQMSDTFLKIYDITIAKIPCFLGKTLVISMEYIYGTTLASPQFRNRLQNLSFDHKVRILYRIIEAVNELENAGVVHTNLHPNHILLSEDLKKIKICGFINNARLAFETLDKDQVATAIKTEEFHFRPVELVTFVHFITTPGPMVTSAMDVWSIGVIFAFMLRNGLSLFNETNNLGQPWGSIFTTLGNPTEDELRNGLKSQQILRIAPARHEYEQLKKAIPRADRLPVKWLKLLNDMLDYHPRRRITIKQLVNHHIFTDFFREYPILAMDKDDLDIDKKSQLEQIRIEIPEDIRAWKRKDIKKFIELCVSMRKDMVEEKRKDLMVLIKDLVNRTTIPRGIWITIITMADTRPIYISVRKKINTRGRKVSKDLSIIELPKAEHRTVACTSNFFEILAEKEK